MFEVSGFVTEAVLDFFREGSLLLPQLFLPRLFTLGDTHRSLNTIFLGVNSLLPEENECGPEPKNIYVGIDYFVDG